MSVALPETQDAVQLTGSDRLVLNREKAVYRAGRHQVVGQVEAVGLCFSDLKLLKQFTSHVRKSEVVSGIAPEALAEIPVYVPGDQPTVPGHEAAVRIVEVGDAVEGVAVGERYLVQTDYRWVRTAHSNAAFGYNFEGALQEYVLMDQRVITSPEGESMLIPASDGLSAAAVALVEPWACVEDSYVTPERQTLKAGGALLAVGDAPGAAARTAAFLDGQAVVPGKVTWCGSEAAPRTAAVPVTVTESVDELPGEGFDDILYFGSDPSRLEMLFTKLAPKGLINIMLCGGTLGRAVVTPVGRVHYGGIRITGTSGNDPSAGLAIIPATGELREGDAVCVVGAGGPMGTMHVVRHLCQGVPGVSVFAGDLSDERLAALQAVAGPEAVANGVPFTTYNAKTNAPDRTFDLIAMMVPVPALVAAAIGMASPRALINIFAGIPMEVTHPMDLDTYLARQVYFIGTSGSTLSDMKTVLAKVEARRLDTNLSVAAVCGLDGAVEGIRAVEKQAVDGKILVYPKCKGLGLTTLGKLAERYPEVAARLRNGRWTLEAEQALLEAF